MSKIIGTGNIGGKIYTSEKPYEVDLAPVEEYKSKLEEALVTEENRRDRKSVELTTYFLRAAREMNKEQLKYLVTELVGILEKWTRLYQSTLDNPEEHLKQIKEYRKLEEMIKKTVPPDALEAVRAYRRAQDIIDKTKQELPSELEEKMR